MKILVVAEPFLPSVGGMQYSSYQTLLSLNNLSVDITIISPKYDGYQEFDKDCILDIIRVGEAGYFGSISRLIKANKLSKNFDIVMFMGHHPDFSYGLLFPFMKFKPILLFAGTQLEFTSNILKFNIGKIFLSKTYNNALGVISISNDLIRVFKKYSKNFNGPITKIPRPLDNNIWGKTKLNKVNNDVFSILTVTRLEKDKNVDDIINILKKIKDSGLKIKYNILGDGIDNHRLKELVNNLGLSGEVKFLGNINHKNLPEFYKKSDLFILLSKAHKIKGKYLGETFGRVYVESFSQATPVIGYRTAGVSEVIEDNINGFLINVNDVNSVYEKIIYLMKNKDILEQMGNNAINSYKTKYTSDIVGEKILNFLKNINK